MDKFNAAHQKIADLIHEYDVAEKALAGDYQYEIFFKKGITYDPKGQIARTPGFETES